MAFVVYNTYLLVETVFFMWRITVMLAMALRSLNGIVSRVISLHVLPSFLNTAYFGISIRSDHVQTDVSERTVLGGSSEAFKRTRQLPEPPTVLHARQIRNSAWN